MNRIDAARAYTCASELYRDAVREVAQHPESMQGRWFDQLEAARQYLADAYAAYLAVWA